MLTARRHRRARGSEKEGRPRVTQDKKKKEKKKERTPDEREDKRPKSKEKKPRWLKI